MVVIKKGLGFNATHWRGALVVTKALNSLLTKPLKESKLPSERSFSKIIAG